MAGIRIQHSTERNTAFTLVDPNRPLTEPWECPVCHLTHVFKTYHLQLDAAGATIVSEEVLERLKAIGGQPFSFGEVVDRPPKQTISIKSAGGR